MASNGGQEVACSSRNGQVSCRAAVRISEEKMKFAKAAEQNFSTEIFRIIKVIDRRPRAVYKLEDRNGTPIDGQFYQEELTPVRITSRTTYKIDKILDKRVRRGIQRPQNFLPCWFLKILWDVKLFFTLCCFLNYSHVVLGLKCKNLIVRKYIIVILYFHCLCQKTWVKWLTFCMSEECWGPKLWVTWTW